MTSTREIIAADLALRRDAAQKAYQEKLAAELAPPEDAAAATEPEPTLNPATEP